MNTDNTKYVPPLLPEGEKTNLEMKIMKEGTCKRCGKKWDHKHRCIKEKKPRTCINVKQLMS